MYHAALLYHSQGQKIRPASLGNRVGRWTMIAYCVSLIPDPYSLVTGHWSLVTGHSSIVPWKRTVPPPIPYIEWKEERPAPALDPDPVLPETQHIILRFRF